jgi:hypothetical protein
MIAVYNSEADIFFSPVVDGPGKFGETNGKPLRQISRFGRSFSVVRVPYSFKQLIQELQVINVQMRLITDANVDQLLCMTKSDNVNKLLDIKTDTADDFKFLVDAHIEASSKLQNRVDNPTSLETRMGELKLATPVEQIRQPVKRAPPVEEVVADAEFVMPEWNAIQEGREEGQQGQQIQGPTWGWTNVAVNDDDWQTQGQQTQGQTQGQIQQQTQGQIQQPTQGPTQGQTQGQQIQEDYDSDWDKPTVLPVAQTQGQQQPMQGQQTQGQQQPMQGQQTQGQPVEPEKEPVLPPNWTKQMSKTGVPYYFNTLTGKSVWSLSDIPTIKPTILTTIEAEPSKEDADKKKDEDETRKIK